MVELETLAMVSRFEFEVEPQGTAQTGEAVYGFLVINDDAQIERRGLRLLME